MRILLFFLVLPLFAACTDDAEPEPRSASADTVTVRVMTYNIEDARGDDLRNPDHPRLKQVAAVIQQLRPDILLINEIAYDEEGAPGIEAGQAAGTNARLFVDNFLARAQADSLQPIRFEVFAAPSNTGLPSGQDYDRSGEAVTTFAEPPPGDPATGAPGAQTDEGRAYGNDGFGFGTFPGQYAMAVLVNPELQIDREAIRTLQTFRWRDLPGALVPTDETGAPWYDEAAWENFRLSSKSFWDVPVTLPNGAVLHVIASHPTPPSFDGPEQRNKKRNHDEIRLIREYISNSDFLYDDQGRRGGLADDAHFVIMGDLNADPDEGNAYDNPIQNLIFSHPRVNSAFTPQARRPNSELDPDDTAGWGLRVDYVLPSTGMDVLDGGIWGHQAIFGAVATDENAPEEYLGNQGGAGSPVPSDHFPVWLDLRVPPPGQR